MKSYEIWALSVRIRRVILGNAHQRYNLNLYYGVYRELLAQRDYDPRILCVIPLRVMPLCY